MNSLFINTSTTSNDEELKYTLNTMTGNSDLTVLHFIRFSGIRFLFVNSLDYFQANTLLKLMNYMLKKGEKMNLKSYVLF